MPFKDLKINNQIFALRINGKKTKRKTKELLKILSQDEKEIFKKIKDSQTARRYLLARILTREKIAGLVKMWPEKLMFKINEFGRPELAFPQIKNFDFNLSHSGDWVLLAITSGRVGVDIEKIQPIDFSVMKSCFHEKEIKKVFSRRGEELKNFYKIWVLKESFVKAMGQGMSYSLKSFNFSFRKNKIKFHSKAKKQKWYFKLYSICPGYQAAVCINKPGKIAITMYE